MDPNTLPLSDLSFFQQLAQKSGVEITRELIGCAQATVTTEVGEIATAVANRNEHDLQAASHALKGACYSMQALRLAHFCREMELAASDFEKADQILPKLQIVADDTIKWWIDVLESQQYMTARP